MSMRSLCREKERWSKGSILYKYRSDKEEYDAEVYHGVGRRYNE